MREPEILIFPSVDALAEAAAQRIAGLAEAAAGAIHCRNFMAK